MELKGRHFLWISLFCRLVYAIDSLNTCEAPAVPEGQPASITCYFDRDVTKEEKAYAIHKYNSKGDFTEIVNCPWITDTHACDTEIGYKLEGRATNTVKLRILNATKDNVGRYVCQVIPSDPASLEPCNFTLTDKTAATEPTDSSSGSSENEDDDGSLLLAVLLPVILVVILVASILVVFLLRRRGFPLQSCPSKLRRTRDDKPAEESVGESLLTDVKPQVTKGEKPAEQELLAKCNEQAPPKSDEKVPPRPPRLDQRKEVLSACKNNDVNKLNRLIATGASVNFNNPDDESDGETPLHVVCGDGHEQLLTVLLEKGANIEARDKKGLTPLHWACKGGKELVVTKLLEKNADVNAEGMDRTTPLHLASEGGYTSIVDMLLRKGAEVDAADGKGMTPLHRACRTGQADTIKALVIWKADVNKQAGGGLTPLLIACQNKQQAVLDILLENKALNLKAAAEDEKTALHIACNTGQLSLVTALLTKDSKVNARDEAENTPLHLACRQGNKEIVDVLCDNGADVTAKNADTHTPKDIAKRCSQKEIVELLRQKAKKTTRPRSQGKFSTEPKSVSPPQPTEGKSNTQGTSPRQVMNEKKSQEITGAATHELKETTMSESKC